MERGANRRLIAAAPELLAALEALTEPFSAYNLKPEESHHERNMWQERINAAMISARAAIAKAKGQA